MAAADDVDIAIDAARRLRVHAAARPDRFRGDRRGAASAGWVIRISPRSSSRRSRTRASSRSPGRWRATTSARRRRPRSRSSSASACSATSRGRSDCALDGPSCTAQSRHAVGRQPGDGRASRGHAVPAGHRGRHPVPRGRRRASVSRRADALPAVARGHPRAAARGPARRIHRIPAEWQRRRLRPRGGDCARPRARCRADLHGPAVRPRSRQADAAGRAVAARWMCATAHATLRLSDYRV